MSLFFVMTSRFVVGACALLFATAPLAQRASLAVCPLSEDETQASVDAFAKIVPTLTGEPRCVNCHGGMDPFKQPGPHSDGVYPDTQCDSCHDNMVPRTNGQPSEWHLAPAFMSFVGKSDRALCEQVKANAEGPCANGVCDQWPLAEKFIGHVTDDEGKDNFTATAFAGTRGLTGDDPPPQKPSITHAQLLALGHAWVDATGGKWQGSKDCGCGPTNYALRFTAVTTIPGEDFRNEMAPLEIPIEFAADGTFSGDSMASFRGGDRLDDCVAQSTASMRLVVSGSAVQTAEQHFLEVTLKTGSAMRSQANVRCPDAALGRELTASTDETWQVRLEGKVGEVANIPMRPLAPGVVTTAQVQIVKVEE
jgi:hypothetical protein